MNKEPEFLKEVKNEIANAPVAKSQLNELMTRYPQAHLNENDVNNIVNKAVSAKGANAVKDKVVDLFIDTLKHSEKPEDKMIANELATRRLTAQQPKTAFDSGAVLNVSVGSRTFNITINDISQEQVAKLNSPTASNADREGFMKNALEYARKHPDRISITEVRPGNEKEAITPSRLDNIIASYSKAGLAVTPKSIEAQKIEGVVTVMIADKRYDIHYDTSLSDGSKMAKTAVAVIKARPNDLNGILSFATEGGLVSKIEESSAGMAKRPIDPQKFDDIYTNNMDKMKIITKSA